MAKRRHFVSMCAKGGSWKGESSAAIIDSQSVKTTEKRDHVAMTLARRCHIVVDSRGGASCGIP